ncbi:MAG: M50 family metallopeptidase [Alphaproteobacteria bacterium]|nr:M50 family metallopeptidase [Alphaproteobacteria bacterium]
MSLNKSQWSHIAGLVGIGVVAMLFWDSAWLWPLKVLVVFFHELGHALAAVATGGSVVSIELSPAQGGLTKTLGGLRFFVLSAGYLGSLAFGILWLFLGRTERRSRVGVWLLALVLFGATAWWVRPIASFGFGFAVLASIGAIALARWAPPSASQWFLRTIGVFSVMYAAWDIRDDILARPGMESDATMLADITFIPGVVWGVVWLAVGAGTLFALRKWIL